MNDKLSMVLGLIPRGSNKTWIGILFSSINITLLTVSVYFAQTERKDAQTLNDRLSLRAVTFHNIVNLSFSFAIILLSYVNNSNSKTLFDSWEQLVNNSGFKFESKLPKQYICELLFVVIYGSIDLAFLFSLLEKQESFCTFVLLIHSAWTSKTIVHDYKRFSLRVRDGFEFTTGKLSESKSVIKELSVYSLLTNIATGISTTFGLEVALLLLKDSCQLIYCLYNLIVHLLNFSDKLNTNYVAPTTSFLFLFSWLCDIWNIVHSTELLLDEICICGAVITAAVTNNKYLCVCICCIYMLAKSFNKELTKLVLENRKEEHKDTEKIQLHLAVRKIPYIDAYGFCNIDYSFLYNLAALTTTYLVILTQFSSF